MWILHEAGCTNPRDQVTEIINCEKKEMLPLTKEEKWSYYKTKTMQHMQKKVTDEFARDEFYCKVQDPSY